MRQYGIPYQGSKSKIADRLLDVLPRAEVFVDLFAGGCAMTHAAMLSGKFRRFVANDISPMPTQCFHIAATGGYANETRWISREEFKRLKDSDPLVRYCWSFGTAGENYLYAEEIEPWKKALHFARVQRDASLFEEFGIHTDGTAADIMVHYDEYREKYIRWWLSRQQYTSAHLDELIRQSREDVAKSKEELRGYLLTALKASGLTQAEVQRRLGTQMAGHYFGRSQWEFPTQEYYEMMQSFMPALDQDYNAVIGIFRLRQHLQRLQSLQSLQRLQGLPPLQRLQRLQRLQSLQRLTISSGDYRDVRIPANATVYCDPPYRDTEGYNGMTFDHGEFWQWVAARDFPVYVSEYSAPEGFVPIFKTTRRSLMQGGSGAVVVEKLFVHRRFADVCTPCRPPVQPELFVV